MISVSKQAVLRFSQIARQKNVTKFLFKVEGGGCNGFKYMLEPMQEDPKKMDEIVPLAQNLDLVVDNHSVLFLIGTNIDYTTDDIMGSKFDFTNPNAKGNCGCGATFSV